MKKQKFAIRGELTPNTIELTTGLTIEQVQERYDKGWANVTKIGSSKSVGEILMKNIFSFFNFVCLGLFLWIVSVSTSFDDLKNTTFILVIAINVAIGIFQELKAKATMDNLTLMASPDVTALRAGYEKSIKLNEIVKDDIIILNAGKQICSDSIVVAGELEVNESLLTGESLPIKKCVGDELFSGSFVVSGTGKCQVSKIAEQNYIQQLAEKAKEFKEVKSELIRSIKAIMRAISIVIIPLLLLSFFNNLNEQLLIINQTTNVFVPEQKFFQAVPYLFSFFGSFGEFWVSEANKNAIMSTSAGMIGLIPAGMFLLTSIALAVGIMRLAKRRALVQELYSIEALARVDMLCLDKTGTITDGTMKVCKVIPFSEEDLPCTVSDIISNMQDVLGDNNQTAIALQSYFKSEIHLNPEHIVPFSSSRKVSAVTFSDLGMCILGAPEYVSSKLSQKVMGEINKYQKLGNRCLLLGINKTKQVILSKEVPSIAKPYALIIIEDNIKVDAKETILLFKENNVAIKVISGDNPITVSEVARRAGIDNADRYISLQNLSNNEVQALALDYTVFGRVSPEQKKLLIQIFKKDGHIVAMTGDGVNDILALKEADCSIAMANGSEATRNVAQIVLLDSNFSSMPDIVKEGRRVVNNVQRSSSLFLTKTLFSFLIIFCLILMKKEYPIQPIHLTFTSLFVIGIPSFILALEPNDSKIEGSFLANILKNIIPPALSIVVCTLVVMTFYHNGILDVPHEEYQTIIAYIIFGVFLLVLYNISKPFNLIRGTLFIVVLVGSGLCIVIMPLLANQSFNMFKLAKISGLATATLLFAMLFLAEKVIQSVNYVIKRYREGKIIKGIKWDKENNKLVFTEKQSRKTYGILSAIAGEYAEREANLQEEALIDEEK